MDIKPLNPAIPAYVKSHMETLKFWQDEYMKAWTKLNRELEKHLKDE